MSDTSVQLPPPPPPGLNGIEAIKLSLYSILVVTPLGAVLVPLIITLFVFTPPQSRRNPIFVLNIFACCSGIIEAALNAALQTIQMIFPLRPVSIALLTSVVAFALVSPVFIDSILLLRILAFYPISITPKRTLTAIFAFPLAIKCARFTVVVTYLCIFVRKTRTSSSVFAAAESIWPKNPFILSEWTMQMMDNAYASSFFLYKIWEFRSSRKSEVFVIKSRSLLSYLRSLFLIALGNFVFPIVMNIASIVLMASDPSYVNGSYVLLANNYVAIIGVVFATVWTRKQHWNRGEHSSDRQPRKELLTTDSRFTYDPGLNSRSMISTIQFGRNPGFGEQNPASSNAGANTGIKIGRTVEVIEESHELDEGTSKRSSRGSMQHKRERNEAL